MNKQGKSFKRNPDAPKQTNTKPGQIERLTCVALIRDGETMQNGSRSHAELRNYEPERHGDVCGFMTSHGRFVMRHEAKIVGEASGQVQPGQLRELLSSDVNWSARA